MDKMDSIKNQEQARMDMVVDQLEKRKDRLKRQVQSTDNDKAALQADFGNIVRIKTDSYSGMFETALTVRQQQQQLREREENKKNAVHQLKTVNRLLDKPYFARIDLVDPTVGKPESIYIGLASFSDRPDHFLIYDWRAPISSVYYDGKLGEVTYQTPAGEETVDLKLKRQFVVDHAKISMVYDTDETVGDQLLLEALGGESSTKMHSIVTTIQRAQNQIIRDTKSQLIFVQGAAGSGKTAAVLQRVAYLLYHYRGKLTAAQMILFSPNQLFNDYIDSVLPELGERNMVQLTFYQYTQHRLPQLQVETLAERFKSENDPTTAAVRRYQGSTAFFKATQAYADYLNHKGVRFKDLLFEGKPLFTAAKIKKIYYSFNQNYSLFNRLDATREKLVNLLNGKVNNEALNDDVQKAIQELNHEQLRDLYGNHAKNFKDAEAEMRYLGRQYLLNYYEPVHAAIMHNHFFFLKAQYVHFLKHVPALLDPAKFGVSKAMWEKAVQAKIEALKHNKLGNSDVPVYLYLYDLLIGRHGDGDIRHVFLDEVQDYSPYQLAYLRVCFPRARFTLLGDLNQAIFTGANARHLVPELAKIFAADRTKRYQLAVSYRSTAEITAFAKEILPNGANVKSFARHGEKPLVKVGTVAQMVAEATGWIKRARANHQTPAVLTLTLDEAKQAAEALAKQGVKSTVIATENQRLADGVVVIPAYLAKGLEFDSVILWNANEAHFNREDQRELLYTLASRAMHELLILADGKLSPLFDKVPAELTR